MLRATEHRDITDANYDFPDYLVPAPPIPTDLTATDTRHDDPVDTTDVTAHDIDEPRDEHVVDHAAHPRDDAGDEVRHPRNEPDDDDIDREHQPINLRVDDPRNEPKPPPAWDQPTLIDT